MTITIAEGILTMATPPQKYIPWQLIAPPATRFFQMADGSFSIYFERSRAAEMTKWAESQLDAFRRLEEFIRLQDEEAGKPEPPKQRPMVKAPAPAKPAQTLPVVQAKPSSPVQHKPPSPVDKANDQRAQNSLQRLGLAFAGDSGAIGGVPVVTQETVFKAVPMPPPVATKALSNLATDPGLLIALQQQRAIDARNGINREEKNAAADVAEQDIAGVTESPADPPEQTEPTETTEPAEPPPLVEGEPVEPPAIITTATEIQ